MFTLQKKTNNESNQTTIKEIKHQQVPFVEVWPKDSQQLFRGYRKQFTDNLDYNLSMMAKRLPDDKLVLNEFIKGTLIKRRIVMLYLKGRANPGIVAEINERLAAIQTESILDTSYIERNIENSKLSPFPQLETTLQVDIAESALLQGRVVILIDNCSSSLLAPTTFFDLMDTPEDTYGRWFIASNYLRIARYILFLLAISLPALYISLTSFNTEMLPTQLAFLIAAYSERTPYPVYFETFTALGIIEVIRILLIRMSSQIGAIIALFAGGIIIGALAASNLISAPVIIIFTFSFICSYGIPNSDLRLTVPIIQFVTMIMSSILGLFGFAVSFFLIAIHIVTLKSFGIPYLSPLAPIETSGFSHTIMRKNTEILPQDETYKPGNTGD